MTPLRRRTVLAANWKMHKAPSDVGPYFASFRRATARLGKRLEIVFFPPAPLLAAVVEAVGGRAAVGGQNCHWEQEGAFTGEVSAPMIAAAGADYVLVGHSERRREFGETDEQCGSKLRAALAAGLAPVLCVGESLAERQKGRQRVVVIRQLTRAASGLAPAEYGRLLIAYEPVWAIGTGHTASPADAQEMHAAIRATLNTVAGSAAAVGIPILYGGSVKPGNTAALLAEDDVDGALVGGASLDPNDFAAIVAAAESASIA
ncbi:MAG TPA: triose-phosphate isomerase [Gemmatimonadota bacterium]|nr:triose-phosphate isomerase [Gemmatimonadota bacterium]